MSETKSSIPNKIYLQIDASEYDKKWPGDNEITWCEDRINDNDIVYYRRKSKVRKEHNG